MPRGMCPNYLITDGLPKQMGVYDVAANGDEMENEGEKHLSLTAFDGTSKTMTFQVTNVSKPLGSVSKTCETGDQVVFTPPGHPDGSSREGREITVHFWIPSGKSCATA